MCHFDINDGKIIICFVLVLFILDILIIYRNDKFKKNFKIYTKYLKIKKIDSIKDYKMQLEFNTVTIILLIMLVIGLILAVGKFDYEKDKNLK